MQTLQEVEKNASSPQETQPKRISLDDRRRSYREKAQNFERSRSRSQSKNKRDEEKRSGSESEDGQKNPPDFIIKGRGFQQRRVIRSSLRGWDEDEESFHEANHKLKEYFFKQY